MAKHRTITQTSYYVEIVSRKSTRAVTREDGRKISGKIDKSIGVVILKAAQAAVREYIKAGKLSTRFRVTVQ